MTRDDSEAALWRKMEICRELNVQAFGQGSVQAALSQSNQPCLTPLLPPPASAPAA